MSKRTVKKYMNIFLLLEPLLRRLLRKRKKNKEE